MLKESPLRKQFHSKINSMRTKIICTIGPSTNTEENIEKLLQAGMDIARINFSHGTHDQHQVTIDNLKKARKDNIRPVIALDTKGPELRARISEKVLSIKALQEVKISDLEGAGDIKIDFKGMNQIKPGMKILIDDGKLRLNVTKSNGSFLACTALNSHLVQQNKAVNIPEVSMDEKVPTEKDRKDIEFGIKNQVDMIFLSFVSSAEEICNTRDFIRKKTNNMPVLISKIESLNGMKNLREIVDASDGIMVARGDLSVEIGLEKTFSAQKKIIQTCAEKKCPVIMATQMLESMCESMVPTRAEISDIGNAVLDGCDCVMLSGETASGKYPFESVKIMRKIIQDAERYHHEVKKAKNEILIKIISTEEEIYQTARVNNFWKKIYVISTKPSLLRKVVFLMNIHVTLQKETESRKATIEKLIKDHSLKNYVIED